MTVMRLRYPRSRPLSDVPSGGTWWWALSKHSPERIEQRFREESVGGILLTTVVRVVKTDITLFDAKVILVQLKEPTHRIDKYNMELCLSEIGIGLLDTIENEDMSDGTGD